MGNLVMNDWDLEAIIRGSWGGGALVADEASAAAMTWQHQPEFDLDFSSVEELEATATVLNELEELYKPFLILQPTPPPPYEGPAATSSLSSAAVNFTGGVGDDDVDKPDARPEIVQESLRATSKPSGSKRKQKQNMRVVELGVGDVDDDENLRNMDEWNWRKYGQKSIKGSPYPRSYYRCSSPGGCKARKQVEQSASYPYNYVVTYIGDHAHPLPARRRSFAPRKLSFFSSSPTVVTRQQ